MLRLVRSSCIVLGNRLRQPVVLVRPASDGSRTALPLCRAGIAGDLVHRALGQYRVVVSVDVISWLIVGIAMFDEQPLVALCTRPSRLYVHECEVAPQLLTIQPELQVAFVQHL